MALATESKLTGWKSFQRLWVAGAMGAFFSAFARTLPSDLPKISSHPDWPYTWDTLLRYFYLLWLLAYFFFSNLRAQSNQPPKRFDVLYDVIQSFSALIAAYFMGFVIEVHYSSEWTFGAANGVIFLICFLALCLYWQEGEFAMGLLRAGGALLAGIGFFVAISFQGSPLMRSSFLIVIWALLCSILFGFMRVRISTLPPLVPSKA